MVNVREETVGCYSIFQGWLSNSEGAVFKKTGGGIYSSELVTWMMIFQRLNGGSSLRDAVYEFNSEPELKKLAGNCKRIQEGNISHSTGGYSQARQILPLDTVKTVSDELFKYLSDFQTVKEGKYGRPVYSIDGAVIELLRSKELAKKYPPHRKGHYPSLRMVVCHDLESGLAVRPEYGPYAGSKQQSEVALVRKMMSRLPENGIFVGDRLYGIFSVVFAAKEANRKVIFRLTDQRVKKILGKSPSHGIEQEVRWNISHHDRANNPDLPNDAHIYGRVICRNVQPSNGGKVVPLYLFTTLESESANTIIEMYGLRWNIEVDLRTLKQTASMHMLKTKSEDMAAKELLLGVCAYNLVIAVRILAAKTLNLAPRALSFKTILTAIRAYAPKILKAHPQTKDSLINGFWRAMATAKHPKRSRPRTEPRALVRHRRPKFPTLTTSRATARRKLIGKN